MTATQAFDLAAQLKVAADLIVIQQTETIDDRRRPADRLYHRIRLQRQIRLVPHSKNNRIGIRQNLGYIRFNAQLIQFVLVA